MSTPGQCGSITLEPISSLIMFTSAVVVGCRDRLSPSLNLGANRRSFPKVIVICHLASSVRSAIGASNSIGISVACFALASSTHSCACLWTASCSTQRSFLAFLRVLTWCTTGVIIFTRGSWVVFGWLLGGGCGQLRARWPFCRNRWQNIWKPSFPRATAIDMWSRGSVLHCPAGDIPFLPALHRGCSCPFLGIAVSGNSLVRSSADSQCHLSMAPVGLGSRSGVGYRIGRNLVAYSCVGNRGGLGSCWYYVVWLRDKLSVV